MESDVVRGTVKAVKNHGTIVEMEVEIEPDTLHTVYFDHRAFQHLLQALEVTPQGLVGARVDLVNLSFLEAYVKPGAPRPELSKEIH